MKHLNIHFLILVSLICFLSSFGQISTIHNIEPIQNHYKELQALDKSPNSEMAWMDTISYTADASSRYILALGLAQPHYLTPSQVEYLSSSVNFPANSSKQTRAELDFLLNVQDEVTEEEMNRVRELASIGYWPDLNILESHSSYQENLKDLFFEGREVLGESCSAENYPLTSDLLEGVMKDMRIMEFATKHKKMRARPYQLDTRITPLRSIKSASFASGHTMWAYIQAYTWSELIPSKRKEFIDLAYEIGFSREQMGVHYPSDEEAARQLAHRMLMLMWHTDKFQHDFKKAKEEWE